MSLLYSDRNIRDKWLNEYMEEIKSNQEKKESEKYIKLNEEKLQLQKINEELQNEKQEKKLKKENIKRENQSELDKYFIKKKDKEEKEIFEKLNNVDKLTLPIKHEERLEKYKEYMSKLTDKIDKNIGIYKNYHKRNHSVNLVHEYKSNSNLRDELKLENQFNKEINSTLKVNSQNNYGFNNKLASSGSKDENLNFHLSRNQNNKRNNNYETKIIDAPSDYRHAENKGYNSYNNIVSNNLNDYPTYNIEQIKSNYKDKTFPDNNYDFYPIENSSEKNKYEEFAKIKNSNNNNDLGLKINLNINSENNYNNNILDKNQHNNYQQVYKHTKNFVNQIGNKPNINNNSSPHQEKNLNIINRKDNYRVNNTDNIGVNSPIFNYDKFNKKVFNQFQNYESYNFNKETKPLEKDFEINKNSLENIYFKDANEYKALLKYNLNINKEEMNKNNRNKLHQYEQNKPNIQERLKNLENYQDQEFHNSHIKKQQQKNYRDFLDDQIKYKHKREPSHGNPVDKNLNNFNNNSPNLNNNSGQAQIHINRFNIGNTKLNHNPIVCAVPDFKYNRYIYKDLYENANKDSLSRSLIVNGNNIMQ